MICHYSIWFCSDRFQFLVVLCRSFLPSCSLSIHSLSTVRSASSAGLSVDISLFPSRTCKLSATEQVNTVIDAFEHSSTKFGYLWLEISSHGSDWSLEHSKNIQWIQEAVKAAERRLAKHRIGIYTSIKVWEAVVGNEQKEFSNYQLWFASNNGKENLKDFKSFAGKVAVELMYIFVSNLYY